MLRFGVTAGQVVVDELRAPLGLHVSKRGQPGIKVVRASGEFLGGVELPAVLAIVKRDLGGAGTLNLDRKVHIRARHHMGKGVVVARLDVHQPGVGRSGDVGQKGPPGRVEDAFGREKRVEAEDDHDARERVDHPDQVPLIDDRVHLNPRKVLNSLRLDGRQEELRRLIAMAAEIEVADQAILEARIGEFDRSGRIEEIDPAEQGPNDPPCRENQAAGQSDRQNDQANPDRQSEHMVEKHLEEQNAKGHGGQSDRGRENVGHPDLGPCQADLVIDVLLIIEQLALRLSAQGHDADSLFRVIPRCHDYIRPHPERETTFGRLSEHRGAEPHLSSCETGS